MKKNKATDLRRQAEERLKKLFEQLDNLHDDNPQRLIHELRIHQIELEMQNEELRKSQTELEDSRARYSDLYDFAPVGYFTFDKNGLIIEANLTGAGQLGIERNLLIRKPFSGFIHKDDQDIFFLHRSKAFETKTLQTCELRLKGKNGAGFYAQLQSLVVEENAGNTVYCRAAVSNISECRRVEEDRLAGYDRYRSFIAVTGQFAWTTNADGEVEEDMPEWRNYSGQSFDDLKGWGWSKALHPEDLAHTTKVWRKAVTEKTNYETEYRIRRHDGVYRNFLARGVPVLNKDGSIREWVGTCIDITERKQTEEALRRSNSFNQSIIDSSSDCIKILDMDGRLQYMSPGGQHLLGIKDFGIYLNVPYEEFWKGSDHEAVIEVLKKAKQGQSGSFQGFCPTADGTPKWWDVCISPVLAADGRPERLLAVSRDITERKSAEESLRRAKEDWELTFDSVPDMIAILDNKHRIVRVNKAMAEQLGLKAELCVGLPCYKYVHGLSAPPAFCPHSHTLKDGRQHIVEVNEERLGGDLLVSTTPILNERGEITASVHVARNISDMKKAEAALKQSNAELAIANKELEAFSAAVSNDLRAPLRSIEGFTAAIIEECSASLDQTARDYFNRVISASRRMSQLIDAMLNMARLTSGEILGRTVNLSDLAEVAAYELDKKYPGRQVECIIAKGVTAQGDIDMLRVVIENLMDNAWKFTGMHTSAKIEFGSMQNDGKAVYFVRDDGAGFNMEYADKLFMPFRRLHSESEFPGLGIGLATVQKIISKHGGKIWAESAPEKGAAFYFTLE